MNEHVDHLGNTWKLGWKAPDETRKKLRAVRTTIQALRSARSLPPLIPRSEWKPIDFVTSFPVDLIEDQRNYGACSCATATGAGNRQRYFRGFPYVSLAWTWLYDQVNQGRDSGSGIDEVNEIVRRKGIPPMATYNDCQFRAGRDPSGVAWYREDVEVTCNTFEEHATAIQMGMFPQFPVDAANMGSFDSDGVGQGRGNRPNHSIYAAGLDLVNGVWLLRGVTSWRSSWGPFQNGSWRMTEKQVNDCDDSSDGIAHASIVAPAIVGGAT